MDGEGADENPVLGFVAVIIARCFLALSALVLSVPASAEVVQLNAAGFVSRNSTVIAATPAQIWMYLVDPARYWSPEHSWSGNSANLSLEARAGGCFCEVIPAIEGIPVGSVEHMRIVQAAPGRILRMTGALGPLQSEALSGTLTIALQPVNGGTSVSWEYVVGGYSRIDLVELAAAVDQVQAQQLARLGAAATQSGR